MENWFDPSIPGSARVVDRYRGIPDALSGIADALNARKKRKLEEREMALRERTGAANVTLESRRADLYGKQIDAQNKSIDRQDRVAKQKFQIEEAKRRGEVGRDIGRAFGQGRSGQAQVIAHSSQFVGPDDEIQGIDLQPEPSPVQRPTMPQEPKPPEWQGPLEPPEEARARAMFEGLGRMGQQRSTEPPPFVPGQAPPPSPEEEGAAALKAGDEAADFSSKQQGLRDQYSGAVAAYPGQKAAAESQQRQFQDAEANPKYRVSYPGGQSDLIDPREEKKAIAAEAADRADKLEQGAAAIASTRPDVAESMVQQARLIRAQISNADKAPITNMGAAVQAQGAKAGEAKLDRENRLDVVRARGMAKGLGHKGPAAPGSKEYDKEEQRLQSELDKYEKNKNLAGPKGLQENQRELTNAYNDSTAANQNPVKQLQILDRLIKTATGLGVRQQMLETYMQHMGGLLDRGEGVAQQWVNGTVGQAQWANVVDALRQSLSESQAAGGKANQEFHETYDKSDTAKRHPDLLRRRESNMFTGLHGYGGKQEPAKATPAQAPAAGGGTTTLQMPDGTTATFDASGKRIK